MQIFAYNAPMKRLELCLEPAGHFPIEPNLDESVGDNSTSHDFNSSLPALLGDAVKNILSQNATGVSVFQPKATAASFQGAGHRLTDESSDYMETDEIPSSLVYKRVGPGQSVLVRQSDSIDKTHSADHGKLNKESGCFILFSFE